MYAWILMFFGTFHYLLNINAEIMRFGDRQFYLVNYSYYSIIILILCLAGMVELP